ncbi:MAG TPA: UDP-N-acetylglucosamine 1-carboxyvinyltransferase [Methylomirabilota bacterium]|jgi:UDP-N-acetylglucosamine 1-carboxyvinyltransferase|nr:UDP-N-acetylglucosamine 1-carboxyvinyltransferase [Methylomirabilota bacterium]
MVSTRKENEADRFIVEGGHPLSGSVTPAGNKNEALPVLAAALLSGGQVTIENVPRIRDVSLLLDGLRRLGVLVRIDAEHTVHIDPSPLDDADPDPSIMSSIRGSILLIPALLARTRRAVLPRPGGDRIGRRRIDTHLLALSALGAEVVAGDALRLSLTGRFRGAEIFLDETSVTATENVVMAAALAEGASDILNAASEPHVQGLCRFLNAMGARITGIGTNRLHVEGVPELSPTRHRLGADHIEIGSFIALAAMTGGELTVQDAVPDDLRMIRLVYRRLGVETRLENGALLVPGRQRLRVVADSGGAIPKVDDAPWPGFPADLTSLALVLATQCEGTVLIHEKLFESRLYFVDHLIAMGARIVLCDPHRAVVVGPSELQPATMVSPDIRAGMALIGAALCAKGRSVIMNARQVDRGYERIDERLRALGARITREGAS